MNEEIENDENGEINTSRESWFERRKALEYISHYFQTAKKEIRIASGFFTIRGWGLVRRYTKGKRVYILVGLDDPGEERARQALIDEILRDLRTGLDRERRQTVLDLIEKMQQGRLHLVDARATDHHAKLYIVDRKVAIMASSNLTQRGLREQVEAGNIITKHREVVALVNEFDTYFAEAKDITQELLEVLQRWLNFVPPWDVYLKTMLALEDIQPIKSNYNKQPVSYQVDMIAQTLRQIKEFGGSMLVASTGLGKTVVAVHVALHLRNDDLIDNIMVIGPKAVRSSWTDEMRDAGLPCEYFVYQALDKSGSEQDGSLELFEKIQKNLHEQRWLIIFDESHYLRNRFKQDLFNMKKNPAERRAFLRLKQFLKKSSNTKVLLLTGSPYARDESNLNNQLYLLPHTAELHTLLDEDYDDNARAWHIEQTEDFVNLSVASQLTTPHVAKYYSQSENQENYILFGTEKRYIPKIVLYSVNFPLLLDKELIDAIKKRYFDLDSRNPMFRECIRRLVKIAWASSPLALRGVLESVVDTPGGKNEYKLGKLKFVSEQQERQSLLNPLIETLTNLDFESDLKLKALYIIIQELKQNSEKAIIFCERRATVVYLAQAFKQMFPALKVVATIEASENEDKYQMKETNEIEKLIKKFAPISNNAETISEESYDVFISTDAHGVGVNMQDASAVINYDIDWTPIGPVQRAGRILRFWHSPRTVKVYTFVPNLTQETDLKYDLIRIRQRWENLMLRHGESRKLTDLPVLTIANSQEINLPELASQVIIKSGQLNLDALADLDISPFYQHTAKLQMHRDYAKTILSDIVSAKITQDSEPSIYVLLNHNKKYHALVYTPKNQQVREPDIIKLLNLIACNEDTEIAVVDYGLVEELSDACIKAWCNKQSISPEEVERICTLYLKPESEPDELESLLNAQ
ncbi:phospholipase D-like domain-containing protein [Nostoc sp. CHAB 5784]|uniref:helicase-related protein n=1 Tax=Nostoc mirabile TaxID=2907820 RepID=UPI001E57BDEB|nr:helicase-related protein [Nostoc mirabile]MCC5668013.1 phospholipase D-like domain-containing protein [Nostoc mirabile CHAB5784]